MGPLLQKEPRYTLIHAEDPEQRTSGDNEKRDNAPSRREPWVTIIPWILTVTFACSTLYLFFTRPTQTPASEAGSYWSGLAHELGPAVSEISYEEKRFHGTAKWADDGSYSLSSEPDQPVYVGEPTQEIDDAWEDLIRDRFFLLSEEEAKAQFGDRHTDYWSPVAGEYRVYLDVMHQLHCLNRIRQSYHPERYVNETKWGPLDPMTHNYHCIDLLRQSLMCHADLTPVPIRHYKGLGHGYIDSDQVHTCRSFEKIQQWVWSRKGLVQPTKTFVAEVHGNFTTIVAHERTGQASPSRE